MKIGAGSRLLFIGDSVTDCGRARPVGAGSRAALGGGYVAEVDGALSSQAAEPPITVMNTGVSGNTVRDLALRWEADVLAHKPDWLSVMIGINDVWRQFDGVDSSAAVMPHEYERVYDGLISRTLPRLKGLVLMSPYYVQDERSDPMRRRMDEYGAIVKSLAARRDVIFVDVQAAFDAALAKRDYTMLAGDRVHPSREGHKVIAAAFLGAVGAGQFKPRK
jgi:lysophospholipase L1-like esterase